MNNMVFVNLPVEDLPRSKEFFAALGYEFNPQFTNDLAACMVISETIYAMLLTKPFFQTFIPGEIADAKKVTEALVCLSCDSRAEVDETICKAKAAGAVIHRPPQDHGFMYAHGFQDLDGHIWEYAYMDLAAAPATPAVS